MVKEALTRNKNLKRRAVNRKASPEIGACLNNIQQFNEDKNT